jgi:Sigma-70 factor, region 1.2
MTRREIRHSGIASSITRKEPIMICAIIDVGGETSPFRYLCAIQKFSVLTAEKELALARRWRDRPDVEVAEMSRSR